MCGDGVDGELRHGAEGISRWWDQKRTPAVAVELAGRMRGAPRTPTRRGDNSLRGGGGCLHAVVVTPHEWQFLHLRRPYVAWHRAGFSIKDRSVGVGIVMFGTGWAFFPSRLLRKGPLRR